MDTAKIEELANEAERIKRSLSQMNNGEPIWITWTRRGSICNVEVPPYARRAVIQAIKIELERRLAIIEAHLRDALE